MVAGDGGEETGAGTRAQNAERKDQKAGRRVRADGIKRLEAKEVSSQREQRKYAGHRSNELTRQGIERRRQHRELDAHQDQQDRRGRIHSAGSSLRRWIDEQNLV